MAWEVPLFMPGGLVAGAALSTQFVAVAMDTTDNQVVAAGAGAKAFGVLQAAAGAGEAASVLMAGVTKIVAGTGGLTAGDKWTPEAGGAAVVAATGDEICGTVIEGAAAGEIATVSIGLDG